MPTSWKSGMFVLSSLLNIEYTWSDVIFNNLFIENISPCIYLNLMYKDLDTVLTVLMDNEFQGFLEQIHFIRNDGKTKINYHTSYSIEKLYFYFWSQ